MGFGYDSFYLGNDSYYLGNDGYYHGNPSYYFGNHSNFVKLEQQPWFIVIHLLVLGFSIVYVIFCLK